MLNGVDINDNLFGTPHGLFIEDAIEETHVLTAGISAEYGRFTGGVINAITKSGGNTSPAASGELHQPGVDQKKRRAKRLPGSSTADILSKTSEGHFGRPARQGSLVVLLGRPLSEFGRTQTTSILSERRRRATDRTSADN